MIKPRIKKSKAEQIHRTKDKAEVFTISLVCNNMNNLVDEARLYIMLLIKKIKIELGEQQNKKSNLEKIILGNIM